MVIHKSMRKTFYLFSVLLFFLAQTSCVSKKNIVYFQNDQINQSEVSNNFVTIFKPDDLLQITISALDMESVQPFNLPVANFSTVTGNAFGNPIQQSYLVDSKGYIDFPILGKLKVGGKTREGVLKMFKEKLDPNYVKNPTINIFISNFKITVSGDVKNPGTYTVPNERVTIIEALGLAGDTNISAQRNNVKVIREERGQKKVYVLDLRSNSIFTSPVYYLQQNDLIYVEPNSAKSQSAAYNRNIGLFISLASVLISVLTVVTR